MQHLERFTAGHQREECRIVHIFVRGASGFSNRRFERRFCPLLPTGAKVGRAGARNSSYTAAERNGAAGGNGKRRLSNRAKATAKRWLL